MSLLSIKIDRVAAIRQIGKFKEPDPGHAAVLAEVAGADGVTCRLREDRLYIRDRDIYILKEVVKSKLTVQIAPGEDLIDRVIEVKPYMVTLVPFITEDPEENRGVDLSTGINLYTDAAEIIKAKGINVALQVEPETEAIKGASKVKVDAVELNASDYIYAETIEAAEAELERLEQMAELASKLGMGATCCGELNYHNIRPLAEAGVFDEFTVGHAVISRALMVGMDRAVKELVDIVHYTPVTA
jgi:pyridoxine 5-phosphate synthase